MSPTGKRTHERRIRQWKSALAATGILQGEWATQHGWTNGHVSQVVSGKREHQATLAKVLEFIEEHERRVIRRTKRLAA